MRDCIEVMAGALGALARGESLGDRAAEFLETLRHIISRSGLGRGTLTLNRGGAAHDGAPKAIPASATRSDRGEDHRMSHLSAGCRGSTKKLLYYLLSCLHRERHGPNQVDPRRLAEVLAEPF